MWRHFPWLLGLILSPLLFGSVTSEGQAVVGSLLALSLLLTARERGRFTSPSQMPRWNWLVIALLVLPLIPLPAGLLNWLDPERVALARSFPLEPSDSLAWLPISISPEGTLVRWWELSLIVAIFVLARHAAVQPGFGRWFALTIGLGIILLAGSDVWYRQHSQSPILGLWPITWGKSAGTFANRNHFSDWLCVASVFVGGWILRNLKPLHSARAENRERGERKRMDAFFLALAAAFGILMAILSQSRGGAVALLVGVIVGITLLNRRSRRGSRWAVIGLIMTVAALIVIIAGGHLFERLLQARSDIGRQGYPKLAIWKQTGSLWTRFPLLGTGLGAYETALSHYKTAGGDYVILNAENEYLELLVETGLIGFFAIMVWLFRFSWRLWGFALSEKMFEPELMLSGLAALSGFAVHSMFEFVFHITATALLAGAILGFVAGGRDRASVPVLTPPLPIHRIALNALAGLVLFSVALCQGIAFWHWHRASGSQIASEINSDFQSSVKWWPWNDARQIALVRATVANSSDESPAGRIRERGEARGRLEQALRWNPYSWQLRLERAWLDLAVSPDRRRAHEEAFETVRLSPLQSKIPLRFAGQFIESDPDFAVRMLREIKSPDDATLMIMLRDSWLMTGQTSDLWAITPDTVHGLTTLASFALEGNLAPLAAQAYQRLAGRMDPVELADKLVEARRPDLALEELKKVPPTPAGELVAIRANIQSGDFERAIGIAEFVWKRSRHWQKMTTPVGTTGDIYVYRARWKTDPGNRIAVVQLAEKEFELPPGQRDLRLLNQFAFQYNDDLRLAWIVFETQADLKQYAAAADTALRLARSALSD